MASVRAVDTTTPAAIRGFGACIRSTPPFEFLKQYLHQLLCFTFDGGADRLHGLRIGILIARPEEPSQPISPAARNNMKVEMGNRLANGVIDREKSSLCLKRGANSLGQ